MVNAAAATKDKGYGIGNRDKGQGTRDKVWQPQCWLITQRCSLRALNFHFSTLSTSPPSRSSNEDLWRPSDACAGNLYSLNFNCPRHCALYCVDESLMHFLGCALILRQTAMNYAFAGSQYSPLSLWQTLIKFCISKRSKDVPQKRK